LGEVDFCVGELADGERIGKPSQQGKAKGKESENFLEKKLSMTLVCRRTKKKEYSRRRSIAGKRSRLEGLGGFGVGWVCFVKLDWDREGISGLMDGKLKRMALDKVSIYRGVGGRAGAVRERGVSPPTDKLQLRGGGAPGQAKERESRLSKGNVLRINTSL